MSQLSLTFKYDDSHQIACLYQLAANYALGGMEQVLTHLENELRGTSADKERGNSDTHWNLYKELLTHCSCDSCYSGLVRADRIPWVLGADQGGNLTVVRKDTGERVQLCAGLSTRVSMFFGPHKGMNRIIGYIFKALPEIKELKKMRFRQENLALEISNRTRVYNETSKAIDKAEIDKEKALVKLTEIKEQISIAKREIDVTKQQGVDIRPVKWELDNKIKLVSNPRTPIRKLPNECFTGKIVTIKGQLHVQRSCSADDAVRRDQGLDRYQLGSVLERKWLDYYQSRLLGIRRDSDARNAKIQDLITKIADFEQQKADIECRIVKTTPTSVNEEVKAIAYNYNNQ